MCYWLPDVKAALQTGPVGSNRRLGLHQEALELCLMKTLLIPACSEVFTSTSCQTLACSGGVTHLIVASQGVEANKYCVSSGWSPLGQNWLRVRCCLCWEEGHTASCFGNEKALQQGCEHLSQEICVLQSPPPRHAGAAGSFWERGMELPTKHCHWQWAANAWCVSPLCCC